MSSLTNPDANSYFGESSLYQNAFNQASGTNYGVGYATNLTQPFGNTNPSANLVATGQTTTPQLENFSQNSSSNNTESSSTSGNTSFFNSPAVNLLSQTAQHSGLGGTASPLTSLTNSINNFGASNLGFAPGSASASGVIGQAGLTGDSATASQAALSMYGSDVAGLPLGDVGNYAAALAGDATGSIGGTGALSSAAMDTLDASGNIVQGSATAAGNVLGIGTDATLSGTLGAAGLGAFGGGILANALGENQTGGEIGGAIGATIGNLILPGLGGVIGGIGGSLFGGLFGGGGSPTNASGEGGSLTASGSLSNIATGGKNPNGTSESTVSMAAENFSSVAEAASTQLGIQFSPDVHFQANYSSKHGGTNIVVSGPNGQSTGTISFDPTNASSAQAAYAQAIAAAAQYSGYSNAQQVQDWYQSTYVNSNSGATNQAPSLPNNPNASAGTNSFQQFLANYNAQQTAGAAPTQTNIGTTNASNATSTTKSSS